MLILEEEESGLRGKWIFENGKVVEDETATIKLIKDNYLEKLQ